MFLLVTLLSATAFSIEALLSASLYRRLPPELVSSIRGISFAVTMLPLLLWAGPAVENLDASTARFLLAASFFTILANFSYGQALRRLPLGVTRAIGVSGVTITVVLCDIVFLDQRISAMQWAAMGLLFCSNFLVAGTKHEAAADSDGRAQGIVYALLFGVLGGVGNFLMNVAAHQSHPFVASYCWEVGAGLMGFAIVLARKREALVSLNATTFGQIMLYCAPAVIGSGAFAYSVTLGPIGLANAIILSGILILSAILARIVYRELLRPVQWAGVALVCIALAMANSG